MGDPGWDDDMAYDERDEESEDCWHEDYEIDILTGRATCDACGHHWIATDAQMKAHEEIAARCYECEVNYADTPSKLCPGCQAYREHQS